MKKRIPLISNNCAIRLLLVHILLTHIVFPIKISAQQKKHFSIEASYGANCNFFVRSYDEKYSPSVEHLYLYHKKMIGTSAGIEAQYGISKFAKIIGGYARTVNNRRRSGGALNNTFLLSINDFNLRHINNLFTLGYERPFFKKNQAFTFNLGILYLASQQQEITIDKLDNGFLEVVVDDRNLKNSGLEEAGVFAGLSFQKPIGDKFSFGIKTRGYFLVSTGTFEAITLTPSLSYRFH